MIEGPSDSFLQAVGATISCCFISHWVEVIRGNKRSVRLARGGGGWGSDGYRHFSNHAAHNLYTVSFCGSMRFSLSVPVGQPVWNNQPPPPKVKNNYKIKFKYKFVFIHMVSFTIKIVPYHKPRARPPTSSSCKEKLPFHRKKPWRGHRWPNFWQLAFTPCPQELSHERTTSATEKPECSGLNKPVCYHNDQSQLRYNLWTLLGKIYCSQSDTCLGLSPRLLSGTI